MWHDDCLYHTWPDLVNGICVQEDEMYGMFKAFHDGPCGGNFVDTRKKYKVLQLDYYWPTTFMDAKKYVSNCDDCQRMGKPTASDEMSLQAQVVIEPFEKWDLDFVGPINSMSPR
jgi:hypothetical protein